MASSSRRSSSCSSSSGRREQLNRTAAPSGLLLLILAAAAAAAVGVQPAAAQEQQQNGQGAILWRLGQWLASNDAQALSALGWSDGGNPCTSGWTGVACNDQGYVTSINLANKGLTGSIPSDPGLWAGMTGLTNVDLAGNQLGGQVPSAIKSAPLLTSVNLSGNRAVCGYLPTDLNVNADATSIGTDCSAVLPPGGASPSPAPLDSPSPSPSPSPALLASPSPSPAALPSPSPSPAAVPSPSPAAAQPTAAPTVISNAPICSCALKGFGSADCTGSLANVCRRPEPPQRVCSSASTVTNASASAVALARYLADTCFTGQDMDTSICSCVQNLLGNDCAKARVSLCVKGDPLCLPFQGVIEETGSGGSGAAAQEVSSALAASCPVAEPTQPGVKATMEFPEVSMGQYIAQQYTQNVANALSSVTNVPTSSISTLDVRPFVGGGARAAAAAPAPAAAASAGPRRLLLQAAANATGANATSPTGASNGVQAAYFLATDEPAVVSQRLSAAANDGTLSARLAQYGINAQAGGLRVQNYLAPPPPPPSGGESGGSSFPLWALAIIIPGALLLLGLIALAAYCCCCRKKRGRKAEAYAPAAAAAAKKPSAAKGKKGAAGGAAAAGGRDSSPDKAAPRDTTGYKAAAGGVTTADKGASYYDNYTAPPPVAGSKPGRGGAAAAAAAAAGGAAAVGAAAVAAGKRSGSSKERPVSPASSKGSGAAAAAAGSGAAAAASANDLPVSRSMRIAHPDEPLVRTGSAGSGTLTPWEASVARTGSGGVSGGSSAKPAGGTPATLSSLNTMRPGGAAAAAGTAAAAGAVGGAAMAAGSGSRAASQQGGGELQGGVGSSSGQALSASSSWRSNVRPASGASGTPSMSNNPGKSSQQAERAKFWAQFQDTWQQVRQTQNVDNEPGSPSSGTNWTDITDVKGRH